MMKKKVMIVGVVLVVAMMVVSATNLQMNSVEMKVILNKPAAKAVMAKPLQPAMAVNAKANILPWNANIAKSDIPVFGGEGDDQNPSLVTDGGGNILAMYESEVEEMDYDIGLATSTDGGNTWTPYIATIDGSPTQPRVAFYGGKTAYGTFTADPIDGYGREYITIFPDMTDPEGGEG